MAFAEWMLLASVVFAGLWSGLQGMLTLVLHPMLRATDGRGFALFLRSFLPVARTAPFNYVAIIGMILAPAAAIAALAGDGGAPLLLTAIGLVLTIAGPLLVSSRLSEPNYDAMLAWDPDRMPDDWQVLQRRYFLFNWLRAFATWTAFALFLAALVEALRA